MIRRTLATVFLVLAVAACQQAEEQAAVPAPDGEEAEGPTPAPTLYDYTAFDYVATSAEALPRTNLEPAPTSYVLFPTARPAEPVTEWSDEEVENLHRALADRDARVKAYCIEHYKYFDALPKAFEEDIFGNFISFYWPIEAKEPAAKKELADRAGDVVKKCEYLTEHYDYGRADRLLESLVPDGSLENSRGPVMVLDLGFDAVVVPMDYVDTDEMDTVPPYWKQSVNKALSEAKLILKDAIAKLTALDQQIASKEATANNRDIKPKVRKKAGEEAKALRGERKLHWKRWFAKNSWGRALACGFSGTVMEVISRAVPATEFLQAKVDKWCEIKEEPAGDT